ncbi:hypothetical protein [Flagellimonas taeanensis]|uniref:hypothetical protein n=1 Tax=Flagellimonas taeanensis TaxID=1005926 RepID=UPI001160134A|nr:hypothetical protein [Allomuricauda taeanensis]
MKELWFYRISDFHCFIYRHRHLSFFLEYDLASFEKILIPVLDAIASWGKATADTHNEIRVE